MEPMGKLRLGRRATGVAREIPATPFELPSPLEYCAPDVGHL